MSAQNEAAPARRPSRPHPAEIAKISQPYLEQTKEQAARALSEYEAPFYARILGLSTRNVIGRTALLSAGIAGVSGQELSDSQVTAVAENVASTASTTATWKWVNLVGIAGLSYVQRKKIPKMFQQNWQLRLMWQPTRFIFYYIGFSLFLDTPMMIIIARSHAKKLQMDSRMNGLVLDGSNIRVGDGIDGNMEGSQQSISQQAAEAWGNQASYQQPDTGYQDPQSPQSSNTQQQRQQYSPNPTISQQRSQSWESQSSSIGDDASPVAPSTPPQQQRSSTSSFSSGSAWDRLRQQSGGRQEQSPQQQSGWGGASWGPSQETKETDRSQSQAQREFDALLDRERTGR